MFQVSSSVTLEIRSAILNKLFGILIIVLFFCNNTWATGTCGSAGKTGTDPYTANSHSRADVAACITQVDPGATVNVPAGDGVETWASAITINKTVKLMGPGKSNLAITVTGAGVFIFKAAVGGSNSSRVSGFTFNLSSLSAGAVAFNVPCDEWDGCPQGWRIDNNDMLNSANAIVGLQLYGNSTCYPYGLLDNNRLQYFRVGFFGGAYGMSAAMNKRWYEPLHLGEADSLYVEDNWFDYATYIPSFFNWTDGNLGGRYVFRYNTAYNGWTETHSLQGESERALRVWEVYRNTDVCTSGCYIAHRMRGGTGVAFDNITSGFNYNAIELDNVRDTSSYGDWGLCDGNSWIDGNESGKSGYLCRDQVGAGGDSTLWDSSFSQPAPPQVKVPAYSWGNKYNGINVLNFVSDNETHIQANRDYYNYNASFNGTTGVGVGLLANRPETCTKGVAYWATDQGNWNKSGDGKGSGVLYKCTATNTWTLYYTPYTYPHPLRGDIPSPPRNLRIIQ
jgi:hypothetical protein